MLKSILSLLSGAMSIVLRYFRIKDDPKTQIQNEREQFQKAVVSGNESDVNTIIQQDLDRLRDKDSTGGHSG